MLRKHLICRRLSIQFIDDPVKIYLFKVNNRDATKMFEIRSKLAIKTPELCR